ncbi:hypothetical protein L2221_23330, partial [Xanthomonas perforans]|nr:hypothetical protein [Xanthomonas perforans]
MTVRGSQMDAYCGRIARASPMHRDPIAETTRVGVVGDGNCAVPSARPDGVNATIPAHEPRTQS